MDNIPLIIDLICMYSIKNKNNIINVINTVHYSQLLITLTYLIKSNPIKYNTEKASSSNNIKLLTYLYKSSKTKNKEYYIPFFYSQNCIALASYKNNIDVLNWWWDKNDLRNIFYTLNTLSIDWASCENNIDVLNWFYEKYSKFNIPFNYSSFAIDNASYKKNIDVLEWWLKHFNINKLKFTSHALDSCDSLFLINWWFENFTSEKILYSMDLLNNCSSISILDYLYNKYKINCFNFIYTEQCLLSNLHKKKYYIIDWWFNKFKTDKTLINVVSSNFINTCLIYKEKTVLKKLLETNFKLEYNKYLIENDCKCLCLNYLNSNYFFI